MIYLSWISLSLLIIASYIFSVDFKSSLISIILLKQTSKLWIFCSCCWRNWSRLLKVLWPSFKSNEVVIELTRMSFEILIDSSFFLTNLSASSFAYLVMASFVTGSTDRMMTPSGNVCNIVWMVCTRSFFVCTNMIISLSFWEINIQVIGYWIRYT